MTAGVIAILVVVALMFALLVAMLWISQGNVRRWQETAHKWETTAGRWQAASRKWQGAAERWRNIAESRKP